jgi:hypothetical protein
MKKAAVFLTVLLGLGVVCVQASDMDYHIMRGPAGTVSVGDSIGELIKIFGQPAYTETQEETVWIRGYAKETTIEVWYYTLTSGYGAVSYTWRVKIKDGKIKKITRLDN